MINKVQCIYTFWHTIKNKTTKILIPATTWISCQIIMLEKKKTIIPKNITNYMIPFIQHFKNYKILEIENELIVET